MDHSDGVDGSAFDSVDSDSLATRREPCGQSLADVGTNVDSVPVTDVVKPRYNWSTNVCLELFKSFLSFRSV